MAVDAVMEIVKAAAHASGQTISHGLTRMLTKLAAHAEAGPPQARKRADLELRDQVTRLLSDWKLEDPNPEAYNALLQQMATSESSASPSTSRESETAGPEALRVVQMSLESGVFGPLVTRALEGIIGTGHPGPVLDLLASAPEECDEAGLAIIDTLASPEALRVFTSREVIDVAGLERLLHRVTLAGFVVLLDALASSEDRLTRRKLLDLLSGRASDISGLVVDRLGDDRWYVVRNMLAILERSGHNPNDFSPFFWTTDPDARVRQLAIRLQLRLPHERERAIQTALDDADTRVVALGLAALEESRSPDAALRVSAIALQLNADEDIRILAVGVLGRLRRPHALDTLLRLSDGGLSLLGRPKLPPRSPLLVATIRALAEGWSTVPRTVAVLSLAAQSTDPELRELGRSVTS